MATKVDYDLIGTDDKVESKTDICFARIKTTETRRMVYKCNVDSSLTTEEIEFWIDFMNNALNRDLFDVEYTPPDKINFSLFPSDFPNFHTMLVYLTWIRMLDELPHMVKYIYDKWVENPDWTQVFQELQNAHRHKYEKPKTVGSNHALMPIEGIYEKATTKNIALKTFKERLARGMDSVHGFFK